MKLCQGLELKGSNNKTQAEVKELDTSIQMILEESELVLQEPTTSITGLSLQGLLTAQAALQVIVTRILLSLKICSFYFRI